MAGKCLDIAHVQVYKMVVDCCRKRIRRRLLADRVGSVLLNWHIDQFLGIESLVYQLKWKYQHQSGRFVKGKSPPGTRD